MAEVDHRQRIALSEGTKFTSRPSTEQLMVLARIDVANSDRLREIVEEHGWPGRALVGDEGAEHAWLLAQHADRQLDFQRRALALLSDAVGAGDAPRRHLAYLTDRVRMNEGREQVYGTQIAGADDHGVVPWPIADPDGLEERRAKMGLEPFADYAAGFANRDAGTAS
jgi:hypothetical protein